LVVTVLEPSGQRVCSAAVTVQDGAFHARLNRNFGGSTTCAYGGPTERKGTYSVTVASGPQRKTVSDVKVSGDVCHVHTRALTVVLGG
jgi:hypothetical protein